jgi:hypothetical protein
MLIPVSFVIIWRVWYKLPNPVHIITKIREFRVAILQYAAHMANAKTLLKERQ